MLCYPNFLISDVKFTVVTPSSSKGRHATLLPWGEALRDPSITVAKETTCLFPSYLLTVFTLHIIDLFTFVDAVKN